MTDDSPSKQDLQAQVDALIRQVAATQGDVGALQRRADASEARTDAIEARALVDRDMIAELQRDGILTQERTQQMEEALKSSRTIGAAIGLIMGSRNLSEEEAFAVLKAASSNSHRKLRDLAAELVRAADTTPSA